MLNRILYDQPIQYVSPEEITKEDFIHCDTKHLLKQSTHFTLIPEDPGNLQGWDRVYYFIKRDSIYTRLGGGEGYVYILQCENQPGILKIGETERTPQERVKEINRATGVIFPYYIVAAYPCKSPRAVEQMVHLELDKYRVNSQKEGFAVFPETAKEVIQRIIKYYDAGIVGRNPVRHDEIKKYWFS